MITTVSEAPGGHKLDSKQLQIGTKVSLAPLRAQVSCDWWRAGHVTTAVTSDWSRWAAMSTWNSSTTTTSASLSTTEKSSSTKILPRIYFNMCPSILEQFKYNSSSSSNCNMTANLPAGERRVKKYSNVCLCMSVWSQSNVGAKYVIYKSDCSLWIYAIMLSAWLLHMRAEWCLERGYWCSEPEHV